ncbi:MAG TPA: 23S rRNA (uracil(1939)-C(5))-methyltransferase RlmD [Bacillota bacterium]|nr:23S rRNA (uracil(1939)-C(5))-methyltransferase RlmD [Bacillota bacterium]
MVKKNEILTLTIEDLTHEGFGVGKVDGYPLFIEGALPGERVQIKVVRVNKNFGYGKLLHIEQQSDERIESTHECGGCRLQHMSYELELQMKHDQVKNVMQKIAHLDHVPVHEPIRMTEPWRYRNKVQMPVGERNGRLITGFYRPRSHDIIEMTEPCLAQETLVDGIIETIRDQANALGIRTYNEKSHRGTLRHIIVRVGQKTNEAMVIIVTRTKMLPHTNELIEAIREKHPHVTSIMHNINERRTNVIFGDVTRNLWGESYIHEQIGDLTFAISARSFFQVNTTQTEILYEKTLEYAKIGANDVVVDAYCGTGSISLFLAQQAKKVYGVEIVPEAVSDAKKNARLNDIKNAEFVVGAAEKIMPWWKDQGLQPNVIVVDPPRKGCDEKLLQAMIDMAPERIVYVSCNPATLARDLKILEVGGFETKEIQPVDMFPRTHHVELVALMSRECNQTKKS